MKTVLICIGTRPEWLKVKPLLPHINHKLLFTGQHTGELRDLMDEARFDFDLGGEVLDGERLGTIIRQCLKGFPECGYDSVLVQGDTASAFACALAAFHRQKKIYHLEAGLRSFDLKNPFPEEGYRQMISRITDVHFCPTKLASTNLIEEDLGNQQLDNIHVVGNTILDNIVNIKHHTCYQPQVLVTMHRRENHADIKEWFHMINILATEHPEIRFVFPMHPNPEIQHQKDILFNVEVIDPLPHNKLVNFMKDCMTIITDSGGLQEEGAFLSKKVLVCRKETERPEGITSGHTIMCQNPSALKKNFPEVLSNYQIYEPCPYGDGRSSEKIAKIINDYDNP